MKTQNAELQTKSKELQNVLKTSQEQLLTDTSIPLDLINQLATMVKDMKSAYQNDLNNLLTKFNDVHDQFVKQQELLAHQSKNSENEKDRDKGSSMNASEKSEVPKTVDKKSPNTTGREEVNNAWKKETKTLTVLQEKEETECEVPSTDSPASQSEVVTAAFLAQLTKNVTPASAVPPVPASR